MRIEYLPDDQNIIRTMAEWHHRQWGYLNPGDSVERRMADFTDGLGSEGIPTTFVALSDEALLGSASLIAHDMDTRTDLSPWLASLYVAHVYRKRGIGSALVRRILDETKRLGVETLYLFTPDREDFYTRLGAYTIERSEYRGEKAFIMAFSIAAVRHSGIDLST